MTMHKILNHDFGGELSASEVSIADHGESIREPNLRYFSQALDRH
jgi:hypothetical protein